MQQYDIIGDVHGHAGALEALLRKMNYNKLDGVYQHPDRQTVFLGDLIDRGTENFKTLKIVKNMADYGQAVVVMGNHEFNAICYHTTDNEGNYMRPHSKKNYGQHKEVLEEIKRNGVDLWNIYLEWFRRMPLFLELDGFRAVHACWDPQGVEFIRNNDTRDEEGRLTDDFLSRASTQGNDFFDALENLLKGKEIWLPEGHHGLYDKDGHLRRKVRLKWWMPRKQLLEAVTYDQVTRIDEKNLARLENVEIPQDIRESLRSEGITDDSNKPIFIGHYWFTGEPYILTGKVACLDYSVARDGHLVCYRWDGEQHLDPAKFVRV